MFGIKVRERHEVVVLGLYRPTQANGTGELRFEHP